MAAALSPPFGHPSAEDIKPWFAIGCDSDLTWHKPIQISCLLVKKFLKHAIKLCHLLRQLFLVRGQLHRLPAF